MHQYLDAIGFHNVKTKKQLYEILTQVETSFTQHELISQEEGIDFCEYKKEYAPGIGISACGDIDLDECFKRQYYFPYFIGTGVTSYADVTMEKRIDRDAYVGICEDIKIAISLIFHLQNMAEYMKERQMSKTTVKYSSVTLAGLCKKGTVLLPVQKDAMQQRQQQEEVQNRMMLLSAAKRGDPEAIESLTLDDIDTYSKVSRRLVTEDIFSIVDTYIMPYGVECDSYSILGTIQEFHAVENEMSGEEITIMRMEVNGLTFDVCAPSAQIMGEPAPGRRFKGNIWLQGRINF